MSSNASHLHVTHKTALAKLGLLRMQTFSTALGPLASKFERLPRSIQRRALEMRMLAARHEPFAEPGEWAEWLQASRYLSEMTGVLVQVQAACDSLRITMGAIPGGLQDP